MLPSEMENFSGAGLGLRNEFITDLLASPYKMCDFLEIAPENWIDVGGRRKTALSKLSQQYPILAHGLCLSLGGPKPLDYEFLTKLKRFFSDYDIAYYSEHLSYSGDSDGLLYDLLPVPFCDEAVHYISDRIKSVQTFLERTIAIENISYYCAPGQALAEVDFINAVLAEANCDLLLDINNIYVNSVNHQYDPLEFIDKLDCSRVAYIHIAGHKKERDDLLIDTHGRQIDDKVWRLLDYYYATKGVSPTMIERDNNIPPLNEMLAEVMRIRYAQEAREEVVEPINNQ